MRKYADEYYWLPIHTRKNELITIFILVMVCVFLFTEKSKNDFLGIFVEAVSANSIINVINNNNNNNNNNAKKNEPSFTAENKSKEDFLFEISSDEMSKILTKNKEYSQLKKYIRQYAIKKLIENNFSNFDNMPFGPGNDFITLSISGQSVNFEIKKNIDKEDGLDLLLNEKTKELKNDIIQHHIYQNTGNTQKFGFTKNEINNLGKIFLFKDKSDLDFLGYDVISRRTRTNYDKYYRRYNISTAFWNIGNTKIILPDQKFSFLKEIHYSSKVVSHKKRFSGVSGLYGDGICGAATAVLQGILTNTALDVLEKRNHSTRYSKYYRATIDGKYISTPGLDATVISSRHGTTDLVFKNNSQFPIILVMNYNGESSNNEDVFTLGPSSLKGEYSFGRRVGSCYTWEVNDGYVKSCYGAVR